MGRRNNIKPATARIPSVNRSYLPLEKSEYTSTRARTPIKKPTATSTRETGFKRPLNRGARHVNPTAKRKSGRFSIKNPRSNQPSFLVQRSATADRVVMRLLYVKSAQSNLVRPVAP